MQDIQSALETTLSQTGDLLDQLDHLLDEEQILLRKRQYNDLVQMAERKQGVIQLLNNTHQEREKLLKQLKLKHNQDGLREFIENYARHPESVRDLWAATQDKLQSCRHKNTVNGTVISINLQNNQHLLQLLQGKDSNQELYNSQGHMKSANAQKGHVKA